jgi:hypothetical protein
MSAMISGTRKSPLDEWSRKRMWLRPIGGKRTDFHVWLHPGITKSETTALLAKNASQAVRLLRELTGDAGAIIQGQYVDDGTYYQYRDERNGVEVDVISLTTPGEKV